MTTPAESELDEIAALHQRHGAGGVALAATSAPGLPPGWQIVTRRWAFRCWDALIQPPADGPVGWRLGGGFAASKRRAIRRAVAEVHTKLAEESARRERWRRGEYTEDEELIFNWLAARRLQQQVEAPAVPVPGTAEPALGEEHRNDA